MVFVPPFPPKPCLVGFCRKLLLEGLWQEGSPCDGGMLWIPWMHPGLLPGQAAVPGREEGFCGSLKSGSAEPLLTQ